MIKRAEKERNQSDKMKLFLLQMPEDKNADICQDDDSTCLDSTVSVVQSTQVQTESIAVDATQKSGGPHLNPDIKKTWEYKNQNNEQTNHGADINYIKAIDKSRSSVLRSNPSTKVCTERHLPTADEEFSEMNRVIETVNRNKFV